MSKAASSPTARLLQSSRLFSLPRPLPIQPDLTTGVYRASETATTPYPTHQAIATPASSLHRGDWGLKRAIPGKKTAVTTPVIKVRANDTYEHITDFTSAGDHVQTEKKWAEMGVPMVTEKKSRHSDEPALSVFEDWLDNTDPNAESRARQSTQGALRNTQDARGMQRWKYGGPWLSGMQDGEFQRYLQRKIGRKEKKAEWRAFLGKKWRENEILRAQRRAREAARSGEGVEVEESVTPPQPTEEQVSAYEKQLRDEHAHQRLSSNLTAFICEFLDLPSIHSAASAQTRLDPTNALLLASETETGPPTTHPSAGLSHLRTDAIMHNHPLYGPQKERTPVEARVVRPRTRSGVVMEYLAKLGVGGVVAEDAVSATSRNPDPRSTRDEDRMAHSLDENIEGGNRMWVQPETAFIDHKSRIRLSVARAPPEAVAVRTGDKAKLDEIVAAKSGLLTGLSDRRASTVAPPRPEPNTTSGERPARKGYDGLNFDDMFNSVGR